MNSTLAYLRSHRSWLVENVSASGTWPGAYVATAGSEAAGADRRVIFTLAPLAGSPQALTYAGLVDFRGAHLPTRLNKPKVIVLQKSDAGVIVVGPETSEGFALACTSAGQASAIVDLWIVELGRDD
jgi:hypothetical protein